LASARRRSFAADGANPKTLPWCCGRGFGINLTEIALARRGLDLAALERSRVGEPKATIDTLHSFG
jgi:hypothetical protein